MYCDTAHLPKVFALDFEHNESRTDYHNRHDWIERNLRFECVFCGSVQPCVYRYAIQPIRDYGTVMCRETNCGQAFKLGQARITNLEGTEVTKSYPLPTSWLE